MTPKLAATGDSFPLWFTIWIIVAAFIVGGALILVRRRNERDTVEG